MFKQITKKDVLKELKEIAESMNVDISRGRVIEEFLRRHPGCNDLTDEVYDETIRRIYFSPDKCVYSVMALPNSKNTFIRRTKDSDWELYDGW